MSDKQQLEDIKAVYNKFGKITVMDMNWLFEQARKVNKFQSIIESQTKTLEFYADEKNYEVDVVNQWEPVRPVLKDKGQKARETLGEN